MAAPRSFWEALSRGVGSAADMYFPLQQYNAGRADRAADVQFRNDEFTFEQEREAARQAQAADLFGLRRDEFQEGNRRFNLEFGLDQDQFSEGKRRFDLGFGLDQDRTQEGKRQFDLSLAERAIPGDFQGALVRSLYAGGRQPTTAEIADQAHQYATKVKQRNNPQLTPKQGWDIARQVLDRHRAQAERNLLNRADSASLNWGLKNEKGQGIAIGNRSDLLTALQRLPESDPKYGSMEDPWFGSKRLTRLGQARSDSLTSILQQLDYLGSPEYLQAFTNSPDSIKAADPTAYRMMYGDQQGPAAGGPQSAGPSPAWQQLGYQSADEAAKVLTQRYRTGEIDKETYDYWSGIISGQ